MTEGKIRKPQYITDFDGKRTAVIVDLESYERLVDALEDSLDAADVLALRAAGGFGDVVPFAEVLAELGYDALPVGPRPWRWTKAEYQAIAMLGIFDGAKVELLEGEIWDQTPGQRAVHEAALTPDQVRAAVAYYREHQTEIDRHE